MSKETIEYLNANTLIGFTEQRGRAWTYRAGTDNHYPGAIPVEDVRRRLFGWEPTIIDRPCPCGCGEVSRDIGRPDTNHRFGTFTDNYRPHPYSETLLAKVSNILGDTLAVGSAGLLRKGAVAWVQVEVPDTIQTPEGVEFRPSLLATTSLDGTIRTTYKRVVTIVVCDNTHEIAMKEKDQAYRVKHTKHSDVKIEDARAALAMVHDTSDAMSAEIKALCEQPVTERQLDAFLDIVAPSTGHKTSNAATRAKNKREQLMTLYRSDQRVAPWADTAWGVMAMMNTYNQHVSTMKGENRPEKNMLQTVHGKVGEADKSTLADLDRVLAAA